MLNTGTFCAFCDSKIFEKDRTCPHCGAPTKSAVVIKIEDENKNVSWHERSNNNVLLSDDYSFSFIAGTKQILKFNILDFNGSVAIRNGKLIWSLIPYGSSNGILLKTTIVKDGMAVINLEEDDTINLGGKFIQSMYIESQNDVTQITQGIISIIRRI